LLTEVLPDRWPRALLLGRSGSPSTAACPGPLRHGQLAGQPLCWPLCPPAAPSACQQCLYHQQLFSSQAPCFDVGRPRMPNDHMPSGSLLSCYECQCLSVTAKHLHKVHASCNDMRLNTIVCHGQYILRGLTRGHEAYTASCPVLGCGVPMGPLSSRMRRSTDSSFPTRWL